MAVVNKDTKYKNDGKEGTQKGATVAGKGLKPVLRRVLDSLHSAQPATTEEAE